MPDLPEVTVAAVNRELKRRGIPERLARGRGYYYYFRGGGAHTWRESSVYVSHVQELTLDQWIAEHKRLSEE